MLKNKSSIEASQSRNGKRKIKRKKSKEIKTKKLKKNKVRKLKINNKVHELPLMELFNTLQGEGFHTGKPATFIRLAGCDVGCFWCDIKESWDSTLHPSVSVDSIIDQALNYKTKFAVITGGEPTLHNINVLVDKLKEKNFFTAIETAGTNPLPNNIDWVCFSPKKFKNPIHQTYQVADELKVIIFQKVI